MNWQFSAGFLRRSGWNSSHVPRMCLLSCHTNSYRTRVGFTKTGRLCSAQEVHALGNPSTLQRQRVGEHQHLASDEHHPLHHVLLREVVQLQHPNLGLVQAHTLCLHLLAVLSGGEAGHLLVLSEGGVGSLPLFTNVVRGQRPELKQMLIVDLFHQFVLKANKSVNIVILRSNLQ